MSILSGVKPLSWRFYRRFGPLGACLFVGVTSYGGVFALRLLQEKDFYLSKFRTFFPGDLFLMGYAYCMGRIFQDGEFSDGKWDENPVFQALVAIAGFVYFGYEHFAALFGSNIALAEFASRSSQWYHNLGAFGILFFLVVSVIPVLNRCKGPAWAKIGAFLFLFAYVSCTVYDAGFNKNPDPFGR